MANAQSALEKLNKKYGIKGSTTPNKNNNGKQSTNDSRKQSTSASSKSSKTTPNNSKTALDKLNEKYGIKGDYSSSPSTSKSKKYTDYNTETKNAYTSVKNKLNSKTTIASDLTEEDRKSRIKEINAEITTLNTKLSGYSRAKVYGTNKAMVEAEKKDKERLAELSQELKTLERVGTFSASELKQFEIDDAKKKVSSARQKVESYGQRPSASVAKEYRTAVSEQIKAQNELDGLKRQKALYDDITEFGNVVNEDNFTGQWRANYRSNELSREADKAISRYIDNPTEENKEIAYAYDAFAKEYAKNNEKALDDENVKASWLTKSAAGYLPQFKDQILPELVGGGIGLAVGAYLGAPNVGMSIGSGLGTGIQNYGVMRGSVYRTLLAEGVDEETAIQVANDEALIGSLIEGGETTLSVLAMGGTKALSAITGAAKASVAKGSANVATKFIANLGAKATTKATTKAATRAMAEVSKPLWEKGVRLVGGVALQGATEYLEEFTQGAVSRANREQALSTIDREIGRYGEGNIDLYSRPIYKNDDGTISTVDSVTFQVGDKFIVLPTIVRDENGNAKRLESDEEIFAHYEKTGEYLGKFNTLEEANGYAQKVHSAQAYYYGDKTVTPDENLLSGGAKVIGDAVFGGNTEALAELHEQGWEGAKIGLMFGGSNATANNIVTHYANAKTVKMQNEIADAIVEDEESLTALIEEGKASGEGTVSERIATEIETARENGKDVTREQVKQLIESNKVYIEEEQRTAETPDTLEQAAMDVVANRNASQRAETEPVSKVSTADDVLPTQDETSFKTYRMNSVLGDGERSVGIADGQAYVTNSKDILPSRANRSIFLAVDDAEVAKVDLGATETGKASANISKILNQSDFTPIRANYVDGTLNGVGDVRVFTDEKGREIALEQNVAEYFEGYNLEATFRGGKPYAIKATDNDGKVVGVAMAVWQDKSGQKYELTETYNQTPSNAPYNVMSNENPMLQERQARESYIKKTTGFGQYGVRAFADIMETLTESEAPIVAKSFRTAYEAGLTNLDTAQATLPTEVHRIAFNAGKQDYIMENVGKAENVKNVKSHGDNAGFDSTNVPSSVSKQAIDIFDRFCKELGVKAQMTGDSDMYNANITPNVGVVRVARNFSILEHLGEDATSLSFVTHGLHEVADHRASELAPAEYAEFKREMYMYKNSLDGVSLADTKRQAYAEKGVDISLSEAMSEVTANSILELYDNDLDLLAEGLDRVLKGTNAKAKKGASIFKQALDYVIDKFNKFLEKIGITESFTYKYKSSLDETTRIRDLFEKTLSAAIAKNKEIAKTSNLVTEKNGTIVDAKGNVVAQINEDGTATFSLKTFDESGRAELKKWLDRNVKNKKITEADAKDISEQLEYYYDICKQYEDKYAPFSAWSKAEVVKGLDGKPLMSVVKANGDYKMNLDFSLVCKKRRPLDALYRAMIDDGFMDNIGQLSEVEVARINEIIRKNGFETACTLCFVDSKRYRQYAVADSFVSKYNELVKMLAPEGAKIDRFDFSGKREASADGLHTMSNADLKSGINKLNKVIKEHGESTVVGKIAKHLKAVPQDRKLVMVSDFMDSEGFVRVKKANPEVFKLYNSSKGSGGPKATLPDVQYLGEILKRANFTPKKAYAVGGVRVQSFSDYIPRLVFDYLQMTADLSAKKLPAHAYSKEDIFVMQFGKTGIKINMSLVPAVAKDGIAPGLDKDGNYVWVDGHTFASDFHDKGSGQRGFELAVKIQNTEGYSQNCGTIAVGVSDEHIIKMLKDNDIRMVIPYHKSSLNHFVAKMGNIDQYKDYTNVQNTRDRATGKKIEGKDFNFNEAFHRLGDAKLATKEYLAWCDKNDYLPKFDTFAFHEDAQVRENYYKVLIDFAAYDSDGNSIPQGAVTMNFPTENDAFGSMKSLIEKGLEADAILEGRKAENIPKILQEVKSVLGTTTEGIVKGEFSETTDVGLEGTPKYSLKVKDKKTIDFLENQEHITTYKAMQLIDGKLYPPMAAKTKGADGKYHLTNSSELGAWQRAVEDPKNIKFNDKGVGYYVLNKGDGSSVTAAYNPYEHSSNLVLNDQFEGAYKRDNLVTVECVIPKSEMTSGYKARYAKDSTGVLDWKSGVVAGKIKGNKRKVYLSRWLKPVRILTDAETAKMYKEALGNSNVSVPFNVVTPSLLSELEKIGVPIDREGSPLYKSNQERQKAKGKKYSLKDSEGNTLTKEQQEYFKDSKVRDENGNLKVVYHGTRNGDFTVFNRSHNYYTDSRDTAESYAPSGAMYEGYLNITKPYTIDAGGNKWSAIPISAEVKKMLDAAGSSTFKERGKWCTSVADIVAAISDLVDDGDADYDGVIVRNVDDTGSYYKGSSKNIGTDYITFSSEQFKNTDNTNPTSNPDIRFSLKDSVEETKDLVAVHNLWEEKLLKSLKLGGLPMPSIAIVKAREGHSNFGNISLVFRKETISPTDRRNKVYSGDAWTPTYPHIEYKLNTKAQEEIEKKINGLVPRDIQRVLGGLYLDEDNMESTLNRNGDLASSYNHNFAMKYAFLRDSGIEFDLPMKNASLSSGGQRSDEAIIKIAETVPEEVLRNAIEGESTDKQYESEPVIRKAVAEAVQEKYKDKPVVLKALMSKYDEELSLGQLMGYAEDAIRYKEEGVKQEVDYKEASNLIDEKTDTAEYEKWLKELFSDVIAKEGIRNDKDLFTPSGNRRSFEALHYEHTLENVVKAMREQGSIGIGGFGGNNILGSSAVEYGSISEIKEKANERMKSLPQEEYDKIRAGFTDRFFELAGSLPIHKDSFSAMDEAANMLCEAVMKYKTKSGMANYLRNESKGWANYSDHIVDDLVELVNDIRNMPTSYFEAKPQRAVGFNEIATAVIPDNVSEELKIKLKEANVRFVEYEHGNEEARIDALNSIEDVKFSLKGTERDISLKDVPKVRKAVADKRVDVLAKYVDSGAISTEVYNQLIEEFGAIPKGEKPYRDVSVPQKTEKNKKVSQTVRTILEAEATPDEAVPTIEKMVEDGIFSYDVYTDKQAIADSEAYIKEYGWDESLDDWFDAVNKGEVSKDLTAMGWALYNNAANLATTTTSETERTTAIKTSLKILDAMVRHQRSAAQALQATRILKKLSPETQLYGIQKSVQALQNELSEKYGDKAPDLKIDEELAEQFINAKTPEERARVEKEIYKDIGRQMPSRFIDKWNAWRYLAMLGNPRTHVRNFFGNMFFAPVVGAKNLTATAIESAVHRVSGGKIVRGKSIVWGNKADRALLKAAWDDYGNVADMISNGGKYNDSAIANQNIQEGRQIFKFKPLEWMRKKNSQLLEVEDMWFAKPHYAYALAQYCKANNISPEQISRGKAIAPARDYAIKEAQKATYRDTNAFSQMVSEWGRNKAEKNVVKKAFNTVVEGILPFRKTPANILVRGVEYSPLGLLKGLSYDLYQVSKGKMSATTAIDNISAGLTGTGLLTLGVYLASQGLIRGHGEDDEEKKFKELMGHQSYSLELPNGQSITLDWLAPEALPFFVGVNLWETTKGTDEEANLSAILKSVSNITEPMLEMSCLQGLNDLFEGIGYASSNDTSGLVSIVSSAITSYLTQGIPTLAGQAERTGEENRMTTYTEKNDFLTGDMQYTLGKASAKIPFWDYNQIPYIDAWGRKEASGTALKRGLNNFLNPAYTSTIETSKMEEELLRLYEQTGEDGVFPERADKYFTVDGERKDLTAEEYVRYATLKGEKSYKLVSDLVKSNAYKKLSNEEKAKAIKEAYDYANQKAKQAISNYKPETWVSKADEFGSNVGNYISFKTEVNGTREENGGKISKQEVVDIVLDMAQNDAETWKMYLSMYDEEKDMYAYDRGIEGETYMHFLESLNDVDEPTKSGKFGTYTQEEAKRAVNSLDGLTREEKRILWQSVNTGWKKNPF